MRTSRSGQAVFEFALAILLFTFVFAVLVELTPVFLRSFRLQGDARISAGQRALNATEGDSGGGDVTPFLDVLMPAPKELAEPLVPPPSLVEGVAARDYTITLELQGTMLLDHERGHLSEEVRLPPLGLPPRGGTP